MPFVQGGLSARPDPRPDFQKLVGDQSTNARKFGAIMRNLSDGNEKSGGQSLPPAVISINELYALDEAKARLRWSDSAFRAARRRGLCVLASGKRRYVSGKEIFRFLKATQLNPHDH